ncbi:tautomerase family protein [Microbulbifer variabilis]|uniref:Tautomerase family protein n=1 Tax=Microbulbifer variabilis TaxID=266805 RepID=A0ABY4VFX6_9GAMM|nr:tautomerase family protein [Microbulbifer variabilis]USD23208.1 tautomerase family protein [Microbulbifer variabilis]
MPHVTITTVKELVDERVKKELLQKISDIMVEVEGGGDESFRQHVWVSLDLVEAENWSLGGQILTKEMALQIKEKADSSRAL